MAKRFFLVAAGTFLLVAAYQVGANRAEAEWGGTGFVLGISGGSTVWNALGEAYARTGDPGWYRDTLADLPVPSAEVRLIDGVPGGVILLVTNDDHIWMLDPSTVAGWRLMPPLPGGPIAVRGQSFGTTKSKYR